MMSYWARGRRIILWFFAQSWVRFGIVGVASTATYAVLALLLAHVGVPVLAGNALAYVIAFGVSYTGHRIWTFQSSARHGAALPKFMATQALGLGLNTLIIATLMYAGLSYAFAMPVAILAVPIVVFLISKFWVFRTPPPCASARADAAVPEK